MFKLLNAFNRLVNCPDMGKLILRVSFGAMMLLHGINKLMYGASGIEQMLVNQGFPAFIAWGVYVGEVIAPVCLILGVLTRPMALIMSLTMVMAWWLTGGLDAIASLNKVGGWAIEHQAVFFFAGLSIMFLGGGKYSVARPK